MNHDQRIALLQAACTMAATGSLPDGGTAQDRVLFYYAWLQKIVRSPYDVPNTTEQAQLHKAECMGDLDKP